MSARAGGIVCSGDVLLFYHLHLSCFIVVDLKKGEYAPAVECLLHSDSREVDEIEPDDLVLVRTVIDEPNL